jgi:hypothetical protein
MNGMYVECFKIRLGILYISGRFQASIANLWDQFVASDGLSHPLYQFLIQIMLEWFIMLYFSSVDVITGEPISFAGDHSPTDEECWTYLLDKMPLSVKSSKILQKLYIR